LAIERQTETRIEYLDSETLEMPGASFEHAQIKSNMAQEAGNQLEAGPCQVVTSAMRVKVIATEVYTYPDIVILCDLPELEAQYADTLLNPRVIIEVLSELTEKYDRESKFWHYRQIDSLREYILVNQGRALVERFVRQEDGSWNMQTFEDPAGSFAFGSIAVQIPMADIYRGVDFARVQARRAR
jgi:Uma2 family endonuclease